MTLLECLQSHKGSLLRIKSQLFWYGGGGGWDGNPGRVCLILDAAPVTLTGDLFAAVTAGTSAALGAAQTAYALLLIDDRPRWIWVAEADVEVLA
jgi:hypothetical protein